MLLRRFTKHFSEQNWTAIGIELIIVVIGVFIGLQVDNWNEARIAKATTSTYYERIIGDLRAEETSRLARIAYFRRTKRHGEEALRSLERPESELGGKFLIDLYQTTQTWYFNINRATYDELLSGGIANAIPDSEFRSRLSNFYVGLENGKTLQHETTPLRNNVRRFVPHAVQSVVRDNCGDRIEFLSNSVQHLSLPEKCEVELDPRIISEALIALRSYVDLKEDLTRHLADLEAKLRSLESPLAETRETVKYLEEISR